MVRFSLTVSSPKPGTQSQSHWTQDRTDFRTVVSDKWVFSFAKFFVQNVIALPPSPRFVLINSSIDHRLLPSGDFQILNSNQWAGKGKEGGCFGSLINEVFPSLTVNKL